MWTSKSFLNWVFNNPVVYPCPWVYVFVSQGKLIEAKQRFTGVMKLRLQCEELSVRDVTYTNDYKKTFPLEFFPIVNLKKYLRNSSSGFLSWEGSVIIFGEVNIWSLLLSCFHFISWPALQISKWYSRDLRIYFSLEVNSFSFWTKYANHTQEYQFCLVGNYQIKQRWYKW